jgi:hypothetical protein
MPISGYEFVTGAFQDVEYLMEQNDLLFKQQIIPKGGPNQYTAAIERMAEHRRWTPSAPMIEPRFEQVLRELEIFYVPKQLAPGPCFCFVHRDAMGHRVRAKIRPYGWELVLKDGPAKYGLLGLKHKFVGPTWLGNSDETLQLIMKLGWVVLVEGPFDLLACRLTTVGVPVMSSGTKRLNEMHFAYLRVLGVKHIYFMFDSERGKNPGQLGAGAMATVGMIRDAKRHGMAWEQALICPAQDPSACLENSHSARLLKLNLEILL